MAKPVFNCQQVSEFLLQDLLWLCLPDSVVCFSYRGCQSNGLASFRHQISLSQSRRKTRRLFWMYWNFITQRRLPTARSTWALQVWGLNPEQSRKKKGFHLGGKVPHAFRCGVRKESIGKSGDGTVRWNFGIWEPKWWVFALRLHIFKK